MSIQDWAGLILTTLSILGIVGIGARWIVKKYVEQILSELRPNSGSSMKDQVTRLEDRMNEADYMRRETNKKIDKIYEILLTHMANNK